MDNAEALIRIAKLLVGIASEDLTTAEFQIVQILKTQGIVKSNGENWELIA